MVIKRLLSYYTIMSLATFISPYGDENLGRSGSQLQVTKTYSQLPKPMSRRYQQTTPTTNGHCATVAAHQQ